MDRQVTSEEKLLKLIRKKKKTVHSNGFEKDSDPGAGKEYSDGKKSRIHFLDVGNTILVFLSVGLAGYLAMGYFFFKKETIVVFNVDSEVSSEVIAGEEISLPEPKPFEFYKQKIEQRDLFEIPWKKMKTTVNRPKLKPAPTVDLSKQIKVVGIVLDADPTVIVEDLKTKQTFFLSQGESIKNALIEKIQEDKVIFKLGDDRIEMAP